MREKNTESKALRTFRNKAAGIKREFSARRR